ncbi:alpha-glucosidase/alpha-galactosidase [Nocardioides mangrovi]|uniref:Alpha-glucosidase/alpha-galactosidase n=1 Tax=Nocardioides mangrovi TaxID=2874580 RepID=A0ABS7UCZ2_9ACTN|nr:alpha-glucosidase/alpha-galactosidase [Nocardioides mangrovi]MBZ5738735.1 alpha-glucosidase/alpha-galactosidase [Nocardioides mangrovi]
MPSSPVIAFIGAGSVVFTKDLLHDLVSMPELADCTVRLHDIDAERLATAEGIAHRMAEQVGAKPTVSTHLSLAEAVDGADFCINAINVGGHPATVTDFEVPAAYGLRQTIGDTLGVGGIFRALRTYPALDAIADAMRAGCPDAWLLNYTNPMSMNVTYLARRHPDINVLGLCHSVFWTVHDLCELLGVPLEGTSYRAAGVNHQAWLLHWEHEGRDLYPLLDERIAADPELRRRVRVDMYRRLGRYPTETSEHSSEYLPWYLHHDSEVERLRIPVGDYVGISAGNLAEYAATRDLLRSDEPLETADATEYAPQVIHSLVTGTPRVIHATVANHGLIDGLPAGLGVEVPLALDAAGPAPVAVGALPAACAALNRSFLNVVDLVAEAAYAGDPLLVRQAAMLDPNTASTLTVDQIWSLCDAMVAAHGDRLPAPLRVPLAP